MATFKKGDRVRVKWDRHKSHGRHGTVMEDDTTAPWVRFDDKNMSAYSGQNADHLGIPRGYADCVSEDALELITNNMELKITKEKVLAAASQCPEAKETLKTLFPEVFRELMQPDVLCTANTWYGADKNGPIFLGIGGGSSFQRGALYVPRSVTVEVVDGPSGYQRLRFTKK